MEGGLQGEGRTSHLYESHGLDMRSILWCPEKSKKSEEVLGDQLGGILPVLRSWSLHLFPCDCGQVAEGCWASSEPYNGLVIPELVFRRTYRNVV